MDAVTKISRARVQLLLDSPFFGSAAMHLKVVENKNMPMPTVGVDVQGNLYYNPEFVEKLSDEEMKFVVAHEILHLLLIHFTRRGTRQPEVWNVAIDLAVNDVLVENAIGQMPRGGLHDDQFKGMYAEAIYDKLPKDQNRHGFDNHDDGGKGPCKPKEGEGQSALSEAQSREIEQKWKSVVSQSAAHARMQGKLPSGLESIIDAILNPKVDWRTVLWQFMTSPSKDDYRWYPQNRRYIHRGLYLPTIKSEGIEIGLAIDTSGSIGDHELRQFLSELHAILEMFPNSKVHFFECDAEVHDYREYVSGDTINCKMHGRGGTSFRPVFEKVEELSLDISCLVYLTDGYGDAPDEAPNYPVLWVMTTDVKLPWGEHTRIEVKEED